MSENVKRFANDRNPNGLGYSNGVVEDEHGHYVLHSDYEALARQAEALQQEVDSLKQTRQHSREASAALHDAFMEERKRVEALQRENAEKDARIAALEAGMRPFSKFAGVVFERNFNSSDPVDTMTATDGAVSTLYARDVFSARALLGGENAGN